MTWYAAILLCLLAGSAAPAAETSFLSWRQAFHGSQSRSLDAGDFDGDGRDDLAVLDGARLVILRSKSGDGFSLPQFAGIGGINGRQVAARDFNGDGNTDAAVIYESGELWVVLGDGAGGLSDGRTFQTGGSAASMTVADFDRDGDLDVAIAHFGGSINGRLRFMANDGDAGFEALPSTFETGRGPGQIASGDFDGDGHVDFAVVNIFDRRVRVLYGDGAGGIVETRELSTMPTPDFRFLPFAAEGGDLNADGRDDLVVTSSIPDIVLGGAAGPAVPDAELYLRFGNGAVFLGRGDRSFEPPRFLEVDNSSTDLLLRDVDRNGDMDIVSGGGAGLLLLMQPLAVRPVRRFAFGRATAVAVTAGDFDRDDRPDFALAGTRPRVDVVTGGPDIERRNPLFLRAEADSGGGSARPSSNQVLVGDCNGDGFPDLMTSTGSGSTVETFLGTGHGGFVGPITSLVEEGSISAMTAGDLTGNGVTDIVGRTFRGQGTLVLLQGNGEGGFVTLRDLTEESASSGSPIVGDFNRDGALDLAIVFIRSPDSGWKILLNDGDGNLEPSFTYVRVPPPTRILRADLDRDGADDLVFVNGRVLSVHLGRGDGTFGEEISVAGGNDGGIVGVALADFDEDGFPDLAVSQGLGSVQEFGNFMLRGNGDGTFGDARFLNPGYSPFVGFVGELAADDFNGDGHQDLALLSFEGVLIFDGDGRGTLTPGRTFFGMPSGCGGKCILTAADLNGDGLPDLVTPISMTPPSVDEESFLRRADIWISTLFNDTPPERIVPGDANCDEVFGEDDVGALVRRLFNPFYRPGCRGADANNDLRISAADLIAAMAGTGAAQHVLTNGKVP